MNIRLYFATPILVLSIAAFGQSSQWEILPADKIDTTIAQHYYRYYFDETGVRFFLHDSTRSICLNDSAKLIKLQYDRQKNVTKTITLRSPDGLSIQTNTFKNDRLTRHSVFFKDTVMNQETFLEYDSSGVIVDKHFTQLNIDNTIQYEYRLTEKGDTSWFDRFSYEMRADTAVVIKKHYLHGELCRTEYDFYNSKNQHIQSAFIYPTGDTSMVFQQRYNKKGELIEEKIYVPLNDPGKRVFRSVIDPFKENRKCNKKIKFRKDISSENEMEVVRSLFDTYRIITSRCKNSCFVFENRIAHVEIIISKDEHNDNTGITITYY